MGDFDETVEAFRAERRNRLNAIEVREPKRYPEDSAGIEIEVQTSETQSSVLDLSRREALDLVEKLQRHLAVTATEQAWIPTAERLPEPGVVVETKIDDEHGVRNEQMLKREGPRWFVPGGGMYVYYRPTHWRSIEAAAPSKYETLGDIAGEIRVMKADGMTLESVRYAIERIFGEEIAAMARAERAVERLISAEQDRTVDGQ